MLLAHGGCISMLTHDKNWRRPLPKYRYDLPMLLRKIRCITRKVHFLTRQYYYTAVMTALVCTVKLWISCKPCTRTHVVVSVLTANGVTSPLKLLRSKIPSPPLPSP